MLWSTNFRGPGSQPMLVTVASMNHKNPSGRMCRDLELKKSYKGIKSGGYLNVVVDYTILFRGENNQGPVGPRPLSRGSGPQII